MANLYFLGLFIPALALSSLNTFFKHKENPNYNAVGASGAVSAVVFASIILYPEGRMGLLFIPFMIPSWLFGLLYLGFTAFMDKKQMDNIGHNAHFWGSIYGILYILVLEPSSFIHFFPVFDTFQAVIFKHPVFQSHTYYLHVNLGDPATFF
jgi:membrane associated rhomboid family serine protease